MGYVNQAKDYVTKNWALVAGSLGTVATVGGLAYSKLSAAKTQLTQATSEISSQGSTITELKNKLTAAEQSAADQAKTYEAKLSEATKTATSATSTATDQTNLINSLKQQLQGSTDLHTNFVNQLTSGAQSVIDPTTNQVYKLITLEKTVVK